MATTDYKSPGVGGGDAKKIERRKSPRGAAKTSKALKSSLEMYQAKKKLY